MTTAREVDASFVDEVDFTESCPGWLGIHVIFNHQIRIPRVRAYVV